MSQFLNETCCRSKHNERERERDRTGNRGGSSKCCDGWYLFFTWVQEEEEELLSPFYLEKDTGVSVSIRSEEHLVLLPLGGSVS